VAERHASLSFVAVLVWEGYTLYSQAILLGSDRQIDLPVRSLWEADFKQKAAHAVKRDG
jgi:hypothetical protein